MSPFSESAGKFVRNLLLLNNLSVLKYEYICEKPQFISF